MPTTKRAKRRAPRRPGDTDRVRALVAMRRCSLLAIRRARLARRHSVTGEPTGGHYPPLADAPPHTPCVPMHRDWGVPADRCRALEAVPVEQRIRLIATLQDARGEAFQTGRLLTVCGWIPSARADGWFTASDGEDRGTADVVRALHAAPLPSALAQALYERCPRPDERMWRLTDALSEDDAARLEGWSGDRPPWLQVGAGACTDDCKDCWPAGRGIPLADGTLARLAPGQGGRMLALCECECSMCNGTGDDEEVDTCGSCGGEGLVEAMLGGDTTCGECDGYGYTRVRAHDCDHCAGTGRRPLVEVAREAEEREAP